MNEIVIISGKGGTGKTSLTASFAALAGDAVLADCDVDAADLHLVLPPIVRERHDFFSGREAVIRQDACSGCGLCREYCRFDAVLAVQDRDGKIRYEIDPIACEGCGVCVRFCPEQAIDFPERQCGEWMVSGTRCGTMVHARLNAAAGNSGKLVSLVRREARRIAAEEGRALVITDGPPGVGCPVIASVTGASLVLAVTEPTVSGAHDVERALSLARHFHAPAAVCVNKWDINPHKTDEIEAVARAAGARLAGRIRYDRAVTQAQLRALTPVETDAACAADILDVWKNLSNLHEGNI